MKQIFLFILLFSAKVIIVSAEPDTCTIVFYNVENLFDTKKDSLINDEEYNDGGLRNWSDYRYKNKLHSIGKAIVAAGSWHYPEIIGLAEIENKEVLEGLIATDELRKANYKIIHLQTAEVSTSPCFIRIHFSNFYKQKQLVFIILRM